MVIFKINPSQHQEEQHRNATYINPEKGFEKKNHHLVHKERTVQVENGNDQHSSKNGQGNDPEKIKEMGKLKFLHIEYKSHGPQEQKLKYCQHSQQQ